MIAKRSLQLAVLWVGLALAFPAPSIGLRVLVVLLPLTSLVLGPRLELGRVGQALGSIAAMGAGLLVARVTSVELEALDQLSQRTLLFGVPMLFVAAFRALLSRPVYGEKLTLTAALVALTAAGRAQTGWVFPVLAALALATGLFALHAHDPNRAPLRRMRPRAAVGLAFAGLTAGAMLLLAQTYLPHLQEALIARMVRRMQQTTAFNDSMILGSLDGMLQSERVVMRVRGGHPELLRGALYSHYESTTSRWEVAPGTGRIEVVETAPPPTDPSGYVEIEHAGEPKRYFAPLEAEDVIASQGFYDRDLLGNLKPSTNAASKRLWFKTGAPPSSPMPVPSDLEVPTRIRPQLEAVLASWGVRDLPPTERLARIERHLLDDYRYSLTFERGPKDNVVDFLTVHREGHCEYFAAAFVLLARAAHVPARVAAGYRVTEASPLGYYIVRDRNAHSWAEAWLDDRWVTYDPTPAGDLALASRSETGFFSALFDGLRTAWEAVDDWLAKRTAFEFGVALLVLVGGLVLVRSLRGRDTTRTVVATDTVPASIEALLAALATHGVAMQRADTLGVLGERVRGLSSVDSTLQDDLIAALRELEGLRYGKKGEPEAVYSRLDAVTARLRRPG